MTMDYSTFRVEYEQQHPASVPKLQTFKTARIYPWWLQIVVVVMFVCAALMSGVHTVPTVREGMPDDSMFSDAVKDLIAYGSFAAFELSVFSASYALLRRASAWVWLTLAVAFLVMVASNLLQVTRAFAAEGDPGTQLVAVIVGVGAPLVALLSGKILVDIHRTNAHQDSEATTRYEAACKQFDADVLTAFEKQQKRTVRQAPTPSAQRPLQQTPDTPADADTDGREHGTGQGYTKRTDAREAVHAFLKDNPAAANLTVREIADLLKVGKTTVADVMKDWRTERASANGHSERTEV